jgi:PleD family two-component response regulator
MSSYSGEDEDKHLGNNTPLRQSEQEQQQQLHQQQEQRLSPFTKRILIVDDDPDITFTFKKHLKKQIELVVTRFLFTLIHVMIHL